MRSTSIHHETLVVVLALCGACLVWSEPTPVWGAAMLGLVAHNESACLNTTLSTSGVLSNGSVAQLYGVQCNAATEGGVTGCVLPIRSDAAFLLPRTAALVCPAVGQVPAREGAVQIGVPLRANESEWVDLFPAQRLGPVVWSALSATVRLCDVDVTERRVSSSSEWFFGGAAIVVDTSVACLSLPLPMFNAVVKWTNATCSDGDARTAVGGCRIPAAASYLTAEMRRPGDAAPGYWRLPLTPGGRHCIQAHATSQWESVRVGVGMLAELNATFDLATPRVRLPTTFPPKGTCVTAQCPSYAVYAPRSNSCIDVSCVRVWFKQTVDGECRNRSSVVAAVSLLVALISVGEIVLVYTRRHIETCIARLPDQR
jgi:hypothetical protein